MISLYPDTPTLCCISVCTVCVSHGARYRYRCVCFLYPYRATVASCSSFRAASQPAVIPQRGSGGVRPPRPPQHSGPTARYPTEPMAPRSHRYHVRMRLRWPERVGASGGGRTAANARNQIDTKDTDWDPKPTNASTPNGLALRCATVQAYNSSVFERPPADRGACAEGLQSMRCC